MTSEDSKWGHADKNVGPENLGYWVQNRNANEHKTTTVNIMSRLAFFYPPLEAENWIMCPQINGVPELRQSSRANRMTRVRAANCNSIGSRLTDGLECKRTHGHHHFLQTHEEIRWAPQCKRVLFLRRFKDEQVKIIDNGKPKTSMCTPRPHTFRHTQTDTHTRTDTHSRHRTGWILPDPQIG